MSLGENIKVIRKKRGLSQQELADKVGLSRAQISNIESGNRGTNTSKATVIAKALGVEVADLYDDVTKLSLDDGWILLASEMQKEGISPETARKWMDFAKQFVDENKKND